MLLDGAVDELPPLADGDNAQGFIVARASKPHRLG